MQYSEQNFQLEEESSKESLRANLKPLPAGCKILSRLPIKLPTLRKKFAKLKIGFDCIRCNFQPLAILQILSRGYMSDFFACNSDALSKMLHSQCAENHKFSQPRAGCVTSFYFVAKASVHWISRNFFLIFSTVASPVQRWLHVRFSPHNGDTTTIKKPHHHRNWKIACIVVALRCSLQ